MSAVEFCQYLELPEELFMETILKDKETFSESNMREALNMCKRTYTWGEKEVGTTELLRFIEKVVSMMNKLGDKDVFQTTYRTRSKFKPKTVVVLFILLLRILDTREGKKLMVYWAPARKMFTLKLREFTSNLDSESYAKAQLEFLKDNYEGGKLWFSKDMNRRRQYVFW